MRRASPSLPFILLIVGTLGAGDPQTSTGPAVPAEAQAAPQAQAPPPAKPPAQAPRQPARRSTAPRTVRLTVEVKVTDRTGAALEDVKTVVEGPVSREGTSDAQGAVRFENMRPGTYRFRFEHDAYATLEREMTLAANAPTTVDVALTPAPPPPPSPAPAPQVAATVPERPVGEPQALGVPEFLEKNLIGRGEPQKLSVVGCTGYATTRVLQLREPMKARINEDADETLYVVAGELALTLEGRERALDAGALAVIPRGTSHALARRGRNPVMLVSVLSGPPCADSR